MCRMACQGHCCLTLNAGRCRNQTDRELSANKMNEKKSSTGLGRWAITVVIVPAVVILALRRQDVAGPKRA